TALASLAMTICISPLAMTILNKAQNNAAPCSQKQGAFCIPHKGLCYLSALCAILQSLDKKSRYARISHSHRSLLRSSKLSGHSIFFTL
ncbi:MAG: hypothetical protein IJ171_06460, partial [Ruminococcus sp.]|nr:hypothetical protein [Ruminococcus sp.]